MKILSLSIIGSLVLALAILAIPLSVTQAEDPEGTERGEIELLEPLPGEPITAADRTGADGEPTVCGAICLIEQIVAKVYIFGTALVSAVAVLWIIVAGTRSCSAVSAIR